MLFNYNSGLSDVFNRTGSYMPGQPAKTGWKQAPALNSLSNGPRIEFGQVIKRAVNAQNLPYATAIATGDNADDVYGIAYRDLVSQSQVNYGPFTTSYITSYAPGQAISVMRKGWVAVPVQNGTPAIGGQVYVRVTANVANPALPIGGIETSDSNGECVAINARFESGAFFPMLGTSTAPTQDVETSQCAVIYLDLD